MTQADLAAYRALFRDPASSNYRGLRHVGMGPPSSGASTVGEALNILEGYPLSTLDADAGAPSTSSSRPPSRSPTGASTSATRIT